MIQRQPRINSREETRDIFDTVHLCDDFMRLNNLLYTRGGFDIAFSFTPNMSFILLTSLYNSNVDESSNLLVNRCINKVFYPSSVSAYLHGGTVEIKF